MGWSIGVRRHRHAGVVLLAACHGAGTRTLHLSHTTLVVEALCGIEADHHGEPDLAMICDQCLEQALLLGADISLWFDQATNRQLLPLAA
jgi:hypothetical protein